MDRNFILTCFIALLINNCNKNPISKSQIAAEHVTEVFPFFEMDGSISKIDSSIATIYYLGNMKLYQLWYKFDSVHNGKKLLSEKRYHYLLFHQGDSIGYDIDKYKSPSKRAVRLDSIFKKEWIFTTNVNMFLEDTLSPVSSEVDPETQVLTEKYNFKQLYDTTVKASAELFYSSALNDIRWSLSPGLETQRKAKIFRARFETGGEFKMTSGTPIDKIQITIYVEREPIKDEAFIRKIFSEIDKQ